jgi:putative YhdH/YhfP family quinone oxidoreductase
MFASVSRQAFCIGAVYCRTPKLVQPTFVGMTSRSVSSFQAWRVQELDDGSFQGSEQTMSINDLPEHDTLIRVTHSSLNYKDALSAVGNKGVTKQYPHTPGIDAVGVNDAGDSVIVTGYDLGMNTDGGFGEYIRVPREWCAAVPSQWKDDPRQAMVYGTAGLTAGLCVQKILRMGASPDQGKVVVTGASGSVGSVAVEILSRLGFDVVAVSGKKPDLLKELGASEIIGREALDASKKPLLKPVFANAVDTVGGTPLVELLKQIRPGGSVACCGLVAGPKLEATVFPFILRGVNLLGVDSVEIPVSDKQAVWDKLAGEWNCPVTTAKNARDIGRHELDACLKAYLKGESSGKIVLDHSLTK